MSLLKSARRTGERLFRPAPGNIKKNHERTKGYRDEKNYGCYVCNECFVSHDCKCHLSPEAALCPVAGF